jgi:hypothetical protein
MLRDNQHLKNDTGLRLTSYLDKYKLKIPGPHNKMAYNLNYHNTSAQTPVGSQYTHGLN